MNKAGFTCLYVLFLTGLTSCRSENISASADYLIFGHYYGFCVGEHCIQIYKLEKEKLFEDSNKTYPRYDEFYEGSYVELDPSVYNDVKDLKDFFPEEFVQETDTVIGYPDYADGGGLYIEFRSDDVHRYWLIDQTKANVPAYLHDFMDRVNEKIDLINTLKDE